jgi:A/G-specific adenine glycosylase
MNRPLKTGGTPETPKTREIREFRKTVYVYFRSHGRTLPWRRGHDPYHVFVSEIMLQQTQVDRVGPKFEAFIAALPSFSALAKAPLKKVLTLWQGLGYNRRALHLKKSAGIIVKKYNGKLPSAPEILDTLPGIGNATAASIAAFAFNKPVVFLETNIRTVLIHHFFSDCSCTGVAADSLTHGWSPALRAPPKFVREPRPPLSALSLKKNTGTITDMELLPVAGMVLDKKNPRKWYSALMDYGTMLKNQYGNASRRSAQYKKQSKFEGSRRQKRGRILRLLLGHDYLTSGELSRRLDLPLNLLKEILDELTGEKIIAHSKNRYRIV